MLRRVTAADWELWHPRSRGRRSSLVNICYGSCWIGNNSVPLSPSFYLNRAANRKQPVSILSLQIVCHFYALHWSSQMQEETLSFKSSRPERGTCKTQSPYECVVVVVHAYWISTRTYPLSHMHIQQWIITQRYSWKRPALTLKVLDHKMNWNHFHTIFDLHPFVTHIISIHPLISQCNPNEIPTTLPLLYFPKISVLFK